jgi:hypothetical protein
VETAYCKKIDKIIDLEFMVALNEDKLSSFRRWLSCPECHESAAFANKLGAYEFRCQHKSSCSELERGGTTKPKLTQEELDILESVERSF